MAPCLRRNLHAAIMAKKIDTTDKSSGAASGTTPARKTRHGPGRASRPAARLRPDENVLHGPKPTKSQAPGVAARRRQPWQVAESAISWLDPFAAKFYSIMRNIALAGAFVVAIYAMYIISANRKPIEDSAIYFASHLQAFEAMGVKITLNATAIGENFKLALDPNDPKAKDPKTLAEVGARVRVLDAELYRRLMFVGNTVDLCEYPDAPNDVKHYAYLDRSLEYKGLVEIMDDRKLREDISARVRVNWEIYGAKSDNGYPDRCYTMKLSEKGAELKTALVQTFGQFVEKLGVSKPDEADPFLASHT